MAKAIRLMFVPLFIVLVACGNDDDSVESPNGTVEEADTRITAPTNTPELTATADAPTDQPSTGSPPDIEDAVHSLAAAYANGDADSAWGAASRHCKRTWDEDEYRQLIGTFSQFYRDLRVLTVDATVDGDRAFVDVTMSEPELDRNGQRWVLEDGAWRWDGC